MALSSELDRIKFGLLVFVDKGRPQDLVLVKLQMFKMKHICIQCQQCLWTINNIPLFHLLVLVGVVCTPAVPAFIVDAGQRVDLQLEFKGKWSSPYF